MGWGVCGNTRGVCELGELSFDLFAARRPLQFFSNSKQCWVSLGGDQREGCGAVYLGCCGKTVSV